ncbi:hypothetical protein Emed_000104 [Eimeria media]
MGSPLFLERQPVGIENSGNTCYCNAVLQILFAATKFCSWFLEADSRRLHANPRSRFKGQLCVSWMKVLRQAYAHYPENRSPRPLNCSHLLSLLRNEYPQFELDRQNDAHEFLRNFLDGLSSDCNRVIRPRPREDLDDRPGEHVEESSERFWQASLGDEQSVVTDMFAGQQATRITCGTCKSVRHRFDSFLDVSVEFDAKETSTSGSLTDMLMKSFLRDVEYRELDCPFCKRRCEAEVRQLLWRLPAEYLVIHVKRFRWNNALGTLSRINNFLTLPEDGVLNMAEFCPYSTHPSTKNSAFVLEGIVSQSGTVDSGHYTATAAVGDEWYYFSDDTTASVSHLPNGSSIYLLLFRRAQPRGSGLLPSLSHEVYNNAAPTYVHNYRNPGGGSLGNTAAVAPRRSMASSGSEASSNGSGARFHSVRHPSSVGSSRLRQPTPIQPMPVRRPVVQHVGMEGAAAYSNSDVSARSHHHRSAARHEETRRRAFYRTGRSPSPRHFN